MTSSPKWIIFSPPSDTAGSEYPHVSHWETERYCEQEFEGFPLEFRLVYQGQLLAEASKSRAKHKHEIRKKIHHQLAELWKTHHALRKLGSEARQVSLVDHTVRTRVDDLADVYARGKFRFAPLVCRYYGLVCNLDILFLRRDEPGKVIQRGDIDNRVKTLLDALTVPNEEQLPDGATPANDENPFFCLLEDDSLVTQMRIVTDRLLVPEAESEDELAPSPVKELVSTHADRKVYLVIRVRTEVINTDRAYIEFSL